MKATAVRPSKQHRVDPITHLFDELFTPYHKQRRTASTSRVAMNVLEFDESYELQLAAPGFSKENFKLEIEDHHLLVSLLKPEIEQKGTYSRREFNYGSFTRKWELSDDIDQESIGASYVNGILTVTLRKKEEAKKLAPRSIEIS